MAVIVRNHGFPYRPLRGGIGILTPTVGEVGTLGLVATGDGSDRWIVSCFHVLCDRNMVVATDRAPVYQPAQGSGVSPVARVDATKTARNLDCAAARVEPGIDCVPEILGIGRLSAPRRPEVGMLVVKSGLATAITEGVVTRVDGAQVEIRARMGYPNNFELCAAGDSGAIWLKQGTVEPVAMHCGAISGTATFARAYDVVEILGALGLSVLV